MASRLYRTTRQLYLHVEGCLRHLGLLALGTPTLGGLLALYVTGLLLLDARPTQTRVTRFLPSRCHDALNRLLRTMPLSTRALMQLLIAFAHRLNQAGYLCLDDVIVEQAYAKRLPWAGWTYSFAKQRKLYGLHIVVLLWCSRDGGWRIPVGFRLWRPKRSCAPHRYRTKLALAAELVTAVVAARLPAAYIVFDTHYTASWFTKRLTRLGLIWQGTLDPKTHILWRGRKQAVRDLAPQLHLKWRKHLAVRATALTVVAPKYGTVRLVVVRNHHGNWDYLVSNALTADLTTLVERKRARWPIETVFRDSKQFAGLEACQCWVDQAMVRHVALVLVAFVVVQLLRQSVDEPVAAVKERWQVQIVRDGEVPPAPLRAAPPEFRSTA
jgi:DDE superfamily endonuclease